MGKLVEIKTKETKASVEDFINNIADELKRKDSFRLLKLMRKVSREEPKMWGNSIIGFGKKRYKSPKTDREVEWFQIGFSPRKANFSLYFFLNEISHSNLLNKLGKHKTGVGCLYINKLDDIDIKILEKMMNATINS